jgi:hypothetical protein
VTIVLTNYPGQYRSMSPWLSAFLRLELDASPGCMKLLDTWVAEPTTHAYPDWPAALAAAAEKLGEPRPVATSGDYGPALVSVVLHATCIAQQIYSLTGADGQRLTGIESSIAAHCNQLLDAAGAVPATVRHSVTAPNLDGFLAKSGGSRAYRDGEREQSLLLVHHPQLVVNRPTVAPPGGTDAAMLRTSLLALTKEERRVSATARLAVTVGTQTRSATFTANSGQEKIEYRHTEPHPSRAGTVEYIERVVVAPVYRAFPASATREAAPTPRDLDAEKKIFDLVHELLVAACTQVNVGMHEVTGTLTVATGIRMCPSCYLVALQFLTNFPRIQVTVSRVE